MILLTSLVNFFSLSDLTAPVIQNLSEDLVATTDSGSATAIVTWTEPTATDNSGSTVVLSSDYDSGSAFTIGTTTITYTAVDSSNNYATSTFTVTVNDEEVPTIGNCPGNITTTESDSVVEWATPTFSDNSGTVYSSVNYDSGSEFSVGVTEIVYTVYDDSDNYNYCTFQIEVTGK